MWCEFQHYTTPSPFLLLLPLPLPLLVRRCVNIEWDEWVSNLCHELYVEFVHFGVHTRFAAFVEKGFPFPLWMSRGSTKEKVERECVFLTRRIFLFIYSWAGEFFTMNSEKLNFVCTIFWERDFSFLFFFWIDILVYKFCNFWNGKFKFFRKRVLFDERIVNTESSFDAFEEWKRKFTGIKEDEDSNPGQFSSKREFCSLR